nr:putative reverse transcriptase domain-containing protein [Tanacetum cinerariifolium]
MPPKVMSEAQMRKIIRDQVVASMAEFMANMNRKASGAGAGGAEAGGAWVYLQSVFRISDCKEKDKVKFATATLQGRALTWWNGRIASMGIDAANGTPWTEVRKWMTEEFCPRSVLQRLEQKLYNLKLKGIDIDGIPRVDPTLLNDFEMTINGNGDDIPPTEGGPSGDDANKHLDKFLHVTQSIKVNGVTDDAIHLYFFPHSLTHHATAWFDRLPRNSITTFEQMAIMFLEKYFPPSMVTKLRNEITNFC